MLVTRAEKIKIGDGLDESNEMGPLINQAAREKVQRYVEIGKSEGARLRTGGAIYDMALAPRDSFFSRRSSTR